MRQLLAALSALGRSISVLELLKTEYMSRADVLFELGISRDIDNTYGCCGAVFSGPGLLVGLGWWSVVELKLAVVI